MVSEPRDPQSAKSLPLKGFAVQTFSHPTLPPTYPNPPLWASKIGSNISWPINPPCLKLLANPVEITFPVWVAQKLIDAPPFSLLTAMLSGLAGLGTTVKTFALEAREHKARKVVEKINL